MHIDAVMLRRAAPLALPLAIVAVGWTLFVRPASADRAQSTRLSGSLHQRLASVQRTLSEPPPPVVGSDPAQILDGRLAAHDDASGLLERLTRLASSAGVRNLRIDAAGTRVPVNRAGAAGPRVAGAADPDPRIARFDVPLSYSTIPISFDADYATAGEFLWQLRELPTVIEIRSLDVKPATQAAPSADGGNPAARGDGTITVSLTLFAYARQGGSPAVSPAAGGGR